MNTILKSSRYRMISNRSFELPLPVKYELYREDNPVAEYEITAEEKVSFRILTKYKEDMLTPIYRPLDISDIYYFLSTRVFQDNTPFTYSELSLLGLEKYNVYDIVRKTRGITPYDRYWLKFDGDSCTKYEEAVKTFNELMTPKDMPAPSVFMPESAPEQAYSEADVNEILNQNKVDVSSKLDEKAAMSEESPAVSASEEPELSSGTMSEAEIEALLVSAGLSDAAPAAEPEPVSGGMMSQEDIEKMLAATSAPEPAPEPAPASGGKMSQEDIEKMLAAASAPEPAPAPEPEPAPASGGKMSQDDIEKMLAAASAPEPVPEPAPASGGKMSQEDIEKMLAATFAPEPAPEPAPASGGKMSQEDIEALLNGMADDAKK